MKSNTTARKAWHILSNRWNSAITEYALSAARALQAKGWQVIFSPLEGSPAQARAKKYGIEVLPFSSFSPRQWVNFRNATKSIDPDLICVYGGQETFLLNGTSPHSINFRLRARADEINKRFGLVRGVAAHFPINGVITPSLKYKAYYNATSKLPVECVPLGVSTRDFSFDEVIYKPHRDKLTLTLLGRFDPVKGHKRVFGLFKKLKDIWPVENGRLFLQIIGQPANLTINDLVSMAREEGLRVDVDFNVIGDRLSPCDMRAMLVNSSLGIISSLASEVICRVGEEFLVAGAPIMVSGVGSLEELLFEGAGNSYRGLPDNEVVSLWQKTILLSSQENVSERRERSVLAKQKYSLETMGDRLESFYYAVKDKRQRSKI